MKQNIQKSNATPNRKIADLFSNGDKIYIYLANKKIAKQFIKNAISEGFRFDNGKKPSKKKFCNIIAIYKNKTLCYVGLIGHINFNNPECPIPRIDYERYLNCKNDYFYKKD